MAYTISIFNQKGGVGKSTTASNLMALLKSKGNRVLGIDVDSQGHLTKFCGVDTENENTVLELLSDSATFEETVKHTQFGDVIPSDRNLQIFIKIFSEDINNVFKLQDLIIAVGQNYDYIIIDCPPNANQITTAALVASNYVIIPTEAEYFSVDGVSEIALTIEAVKKRLNPSLKILGVLITKYQPRRTLTKLFEEKMAEFVENTLHCQIFKTKIHYGVAVPSSQAMKKSVSDFDKKSRPAKDFEAFADEVIEGVKNNG